MSYARVGPDSDVYVFDHVVHGLMCAYCSLRERGDYVTGEDHEAMLKHLDEHRDAGHKVPERAKERLREEGEE